MDTRCKLPALLAGAFALALCGCGARTREPPPAERAGSAVAPAIGTAAPAPLHLGRPFEVVPGESLLSVRVYRAGTLARAGHNHVIASHWLSGALYVPAEPARASCELRVPVGSLTVDEPELRAQVNDPAEFPPTVPESAREGTGRNMLSEAVLDAAHHPEIGVSCLELAQPQAGHARAQVRITLRGRATTVSVPVDYVVSAQQLTVQGALALRQSDLGLKPFAVMLGALQVQDELGIRFRIVARAAPTTP